jgi:hypothetical protein
LLADEYRKSDPTLSKACQNISVKQRRIKKEDENISHEPQKFKASIENAQKEKVVLEKSLITPRQKRTDYRRSADHFYPYTLKS